MENTEWICKIDHGSLGLAYARWSPDSQHILSTSKVCSFFLLPNYLLSIFFFNWTKYESAVNMVFGIRYSGFEKYL